MSEFPKILYHEDGRDLTVQSPADERAAHSDGFGSNAEAYLAKRRTPGTVAPVHQSQHDDLLARMEETMRRVLGEFLGKDDDSERPRRGRPPLNRDKE